MASSRLAALALALAATLATSAAFADEPTAADKETARTLMREARARRDAHDLRGALERFQAADAIMHVPTTGFEVAQAQADLGLLVEAADTALRVLRIPEQPSDPQPFKAAREKARALGEQLEARIPSLRVNVEGVPPGVATTVTVDGVNVPSAALSVPRRLDPGHHDVVASAGGARAEQGVDLQEKEAKAVTLTLNVPQAPVDDAHGHAGDVVDAPETSTEPAPPPPERRGLSPLTWASFGVAGAGLVVGGVTGLLSISHKNAAQPSCTPDNRCPPSTFSDIDTARTMATVSTIAFVVAGVGAAAGVVTLLLRPSAAPPPPPSQARVAPWIGLGSAGVRGDF